MAAAMRCRAHGRLNGEFCDAPGCMELVEPDIEPVLAEGATCPAPECAMPLPCPLHPSVTRDTADREIAAYQATSAAAATDIAGKPELQFPWGPVSVGAGTLTIGRDYPDQCGAQIEDYSNVSRHHAEITVREGTVILEDTGSTNGTTVNGRRIPRSQPRPLANGDQIGFGADLKVTVSVPQALS